MEKYRLLIFPSAQQDFRDIVDYVNELSPQAALELYDEIVDNIGSLSEMPARCPLMKTHVLRAKGYRAQMVHSYLVFYVIGDDTVKIRRILYGRRQI